MKKIVGLATYKDRLSSVIKVINNLRKQCDHMYVYVNSGHINLDYKNVTILHATDGDLGDIGKFKGLENIDEHCYYITVDDDLNYPFDYVNNITEQLDKLGHEKVISYHGRVLSFPCGNYYKCKKIFYR